MPSETDVFEQLGYLHCRYSGTVSVDDINSIVSAVERGKYPKGLNYLHDFTLAERLELPSKEMTRLSFQRREMMKSHASNQVRAAVVGANPKILKTLTLWRSLFYGDEHLYLMRICEDEATALSWIARNGETLAK